MFELVSNIEIGPFKNVKVHEAKVKLSVSDIMNTATIMMPTSARIKQDDWLGAVAPVANSFNEGAAVKIELGYNGKLQQEFIGFVSRINYKSPLEVECEGYSYQLRKRTYKKSFKKVKLLDILKFLSVGTDIIVSSKNIQDVEVTKLLLQDHSGTEALSRLKKLFNNLLLIWFDGKTINARLFPAQPIGEVVKYKVGWNLITADQLKKREAANADVEVIYQSRAHDGTVYTETGGRLKAYKTVASSSSQTPGERKRVNTTITHKPTLGALAKSDHYKLSYDGYEGRITAFLQPFCKPAWAILLEDTKFKERGGKYIITSTEVTYGIRGARRILEIGNKVQ